MKHAIPFAALLLLIPGICALPSIALGEASYHEQAREGSSDLEKRYVSLYLVLSDFKAHPRTRSELPNLSSTSAAKRSEDLPLIGRTALEPNISISPEVQDLLNDTDVDGNGFVQEMKIRQSRLETTSRYRGRKSKYSGFRRRSADAEPEPKMPMAQESAWGKASDFHKRQDQAAPTTVPGFPNQPPPPASTELTDTNGDGVINECDDPEKTQRMHYAASSLDGPGSRDGGRLLKGNSRGGRTSPCGPAGIDLAHPPPGRKARR